MTRNFAVALVFALVGSATLACSSTKKDKDDDPDGGGAGGAGGSVGGTGGSGGTGPAGAGGGGSSGRGGSAGSTGGSAGSTGGSAGSGGSSGSGGSAGTGSHPCPPAPGMPEECGTDTDCCGFATGDTLCVETGDAMYPRLCAATCMMDTDCRSSCCGDLGGGNMACGPGQNCGCGSLLQPCANNGACCGFQYDRNVCVNTGPAPAPGQVCLDRCTTSAQCAANGNGLDCCEVLGDGTTMACMPCAEP
jgi:hypothetical protein